MWLYCFQFSPPIFTTLQLIDQQYTIHMCYATHVFEYVWSNWFFYWHLFTLFKCNFLTSFVQIHVWNHREVYFICWLWYSIGIVIQCCQESYCGCSKIDDNDMLHYKPIRCLHSKKLTKLKGKKWNTDWKINNFYIGTMNRNSKICLGK